MTTPMVKMQRIGKSAAKLLTSLCQSKEKVQRLVAVHMIQTHVYKSDGSERIDTSQ
jgi:hypothetical protein